MKNMNKCSDYIQASEEDTRITHSIGSFDKDLYIDNTHAFDTL